MTRELALQASNLLSTIEFCDDVIDEVENVKVKLEIDDIQICSIINTAKQKIINYKRELENELEAL